MKRVRKRRLRKPVTDEQRAKMSVATTEKWRKWHVDHPPVVKERKRPFVHRHSVKRNHGLGG